MPRRPKKPSANPYRMVGMGFELSGAVLGGCLLGWYIDRRFGTRHGLLIGGILGIVGGLYNLIRESLQITRNEAGDDDFKQDAVGRDD